MQNVHKLAGEEKVQQDGGLQVSKLLSCRAWGPLGCVATPLAWAGGAMNTACLLCRVQQTPPPPPPSLTPPLNLPFVQGMLPLKGQRIAIICGEWARVPTALPCAPSLV